MLKLVRQQMAALLERRAGLQADLDKILDTAEAEKRTALTPEESTRFAEIRGQIANLDDNEIAALDTRIGELEADEKRTAAADSLRQKYGQATPDGPDGAKRTASGTVTNEPLTYQRGGPHSYFLDLARAQMRGDREAAERLARHSTEMSVELPAREARRDEIARRELRGISDLPSNARESVFEKRVNPNRTDGQGGNFVPPVWLIDEYIDLPRFGRQTANLCKNMTLPSGTDSINMPKIATGTATGVQTADAGTVTSTDLTDTFVNAPVRTLAGQQDVAIQLLDQSPIGFDEVIFGDLIADYNQKLDMQVINGSGASGQALGILNVGSINAVTYTDATPTLPEMYVPIAQAASLVAKNRKMPATAAVLIPSLWYWATAQLDTTNRPLIAPMPVAFNPAANSYGLAEEGPAGMLSLGLPAYTDGNVPSNLGGGTNETRIIVARFPDLYLWEGSLRTRVLSEVLSGTLQVRFQVYNYFAFMGNRRPESISVVSGTGVIPTAGY